MRDEGNTRSGGETHKVLERIPPHSAQLKVSIHATHIHVLILTFNRPEALNAMTPTLESDIKRCMDWFDDEPSLWCVQFQSLTPSGASDLNVELNCPSYLLFPVMAMTCNGTVCAYVLFLSVMAFAPDLVFPRLRFRFRRQLSTYLSNPRSNAPHATLLFRLSTSNSALARRSPFEIYARRARRVCIITGAGRAFCAGADLKA